MVEAKTKKTLAACVASCMAACALAFSLVQAHALPYTHSEQEAEASHGLVHIAVTLDESAVGGAVKSVWQPLKSDNPTVEALLNETLTASENKVEPFEHEDYAMESLANYLSGKTYTVEVYAAGAQGTNIADAYASEGIGDESYSELATGDGVYITITE